MQQALCISSPDMSWIGNSDQRLEDSSTNIPILGLPLFREPGALKTVLALSTTASLALLCTSKLETNELPGQVLPSVAESGENPTHDNNTHPKHPLPLCQHLPPHLGRALKLPPRELTPILCFPMKTWTFRPKMEETSVASSWCVWAL